MNDFKNGVIFGMLVMFIIGILLLSFGAFWRTPYLRESGGYITPKDIIILEKRIAHFQTIIDNAKTEWNNLTNININ